MREGQSYGRYQRGRGREREPLLRWPEGPLCQWAPFPPRPAPVCRSALGGQWGSVPGACTRSPAPRATPLFLLCLAPPGSSRVWPEQLEAWWRAGRGLAGRGWLHPGRAHLGSPAAWCEGCRVRARPRQLESVEGSAHFSSFSHLKK